jgi:hypothetical protein
MPEDVSANMPENWVYLAHASRIRAHEMPRVRIKLLTLSNQTEQILNYSSDFNGSRFLPIFLQP